MKEIDVCPFCGAEHTIVSDDKGYFCSECERIFDKEDVEFEDLRHKISAMISAAYGSEETPLMCKEPIIIGEDEAQGLSDAEKAKVVSMFHDQEGIVWFNLENVDEPIEFDHISLSDAKAIWDELSQYELANKLVFF